MADGSFYSIFFDLSDQCVNEGGLVVIIFCFFVFIIRMLFERLFFSFLVGMRVSLWSNYLLFNDFDTIWFGWRYTVWSLLLFWIIRCPGCEDSDWWSRFASDYFYGIAANSGAMWVLGSIGFGDILAIKPGVSVGHGPYSEL